MIPITDRGSRRTTTRVTLWLFIATVLVVDAATGAILSLLPDIQDRGGFSTPQLGLISGAGFASMVIGLLACSQFNDRGHTRTIVLGCLGAASVGLGGISFGSALWVIVCSRALIGGSTAVLVTSARGFAAQVDPARGGKYLGMMTAAEITGLSLGPILGAVFIQWGNVSTPFEVLGAIAVVLLVVLGIRFPTIASRSNEPRRWIDRVGLGLLRQRKMATATMLGLAVYIPYGVNDATWSRYLTDLAQ